MRWKKPRAIASAMISCGALACTSSPAPKGNQPVAQAKVRLAQNEKRPWLLPDNARPESYDLKLTLDPKRDKFEGEVRIAVDLARPSSAIVLHGRKLDILDARIIQGERSFPAGVTSRQGADPRSLPDELVMEVDEPLHGRIEIEVSYRGSFRDDLRGLYRVRAGEDAYIFSQFQSMDARSVLPCFDEPRYKTAFTIRVRVPTGQLAYSNMPEKKRDEGATWTSFEYDTSEPLPTYLLAFAVGPLVVQEYVAASGVQPSVPIRLIAPRSSGERGSVAMSYAAQHLKFLEEYFGSKHPYPKLDLVAVPEFSAGAMENAGLITFREELLLVDETSSRHALTRLSSVIAHEISHMWFGNLVTMNWWDDLWLNEGFATWMGNKAVAAVHPEFQSDEGFLGWLGWAMWEDSMPAARPIRQDVRTQTDTYRAFSGVTYAKGAAVLDMTERWLGKKAFRAAVQDYLRSHAWGTARSSDLFKSLASGDRPVPAVMDSLTAQTGVPVVAMRTTCTDKQLTIDIEQSPFRPLGIDETAIDTDRRWKFPVCVALEDAGDRRTVCHLLEKEKDSFVVPTKTCPAWTYPNADQSGYFLADLELEHLQGLARLSPSHLTRREQVGLVQTANAMAEAGRLPIEDALAISSLVFADTDRHEAAWGQFLQRLEFLDAELVHPDDERAFRKWVGAQLRPTLDDLNSGRRKGDAQTNAALRATLRQAAGNLARDPRVLEQAKQVTEKWLADPTSVSGEDAHFAVPLAASQNDQAVFDRLRQVAQESQVAEDRSLALGALGAITAPELVRLLLEDVDGGVISPSDSRAVLQPLFWESKVRSTIFPWFKAQFEELVKKQPFFTLRGFVGGAIARCSLDDRAEIEEFFAPRLARLEGMDGLLEESRWMATQCAAYKETHSASLRRFLADK